jgi:hypothetical protein
MGWFWAGCNAAAPLIFYDGKKPISNDALFLIVLALATTEGLCAHFPWGRMAVFGVPHAPAHCPEKIPPLPPRLPSLVIGHFFLFGWVEWGVREEWMDYN